MSFIDWTGNPFVDSGLCVIIAHAKKTHKEIKNIYDITPNILKEIVGNGQELAEINKRLRSYTIVFGNNGPLTQTSTNPISQLDNHKTKITLNEQNITETKNKIVEALRELQIANNQKKKDSIEKKLSTLETKLTKLKREKEVLGVKLENKQRKAIDSFDRGVVEYKTVIQTLLEDACQGTHSLNAYCECSGIYKATNALKIASQRIVSLR